MKVIFFGTPEIAAYVLRSLLDAQINVVAVVTKPDKAKGRSGTPAPTPVKQVALHHSPPLPVYQPEKVSLPDFAPTLEQYQADLFIVVAYGEILKQHLLDMPKNGCINLHASLLPKYRGAAPIQRCLIAGEKKSGVTIMHMAAKMDAGDMIRTVEIPIEADMTAGELEAEIGKRGAETLLEVIRASSSGKIAGIAQNHAEATLAPKIELEECEIDWSWPAEKIHNLVRGVNPEPGAWCWVEVRGEKKRMKVFRTQRVDAYPSIDTPFVSDKQGLLVPCGKNAIRLLDIQLEGKKRMSSADLMRGLTPVELQFKKTP